MCQVLFATHLSHKVLGDIIIHISEIIKSRFKEVNCFVPDHKVSTTVRPGAFSHISRFFLGPLFTWFIKLHGLFLRKPQLQLRLTTAQPASSPSSPPLFPLAEEQVGQEAVPLHWLLKIQERHPWNQRG